MKDESSGRGEVAEMASLSEAEFGFVSSWFVDMGMIARGGWSNRSWYQSPAETEELPSSNIRSSDTVKGVGSSDSSRNLGGSHGNLNPLRNV